MEPKTYKEKTQKDETSWSLHLWLLRGSEHDAEPNGESTKSDNLFKPSK